MQITLKLYATLAEYLPSAAVDNKVPADVPMGTTPHQVLDHFGVPRARVHLLLNNGTYVEPTQRDAPCLQEGDVLAAWPPVAGG